jgi:N6-adenosine-specific RNA methylase IME4
MTPTKASLMTNSQTSSAPTRPIASIRIGNRRRRDFGDIGGLAASIRDTGLLHPVVITPDNRLIAGHRRIQAAKSLKWKSVPVHVVDVESLLLGEYAENELRKDFSISERIDIGSEVEKILGKRRGQRSVRVVQNFAQLKGHKTREIAAAKAGFGNAETYRQAKLIATSGAPELIAAVDAGEISVYAGAAIAKLPKPEQKAIVKAGPANVAEAAYQIRTKYRFDNERNKQKLKNIRAVVPKGKFGTMVIDLPWPTQKLERETYPRQVVTDYPTMTEAELFAFKATIDAKAADRCHLFLWTTQKFLPMALQLVEHFGFRYVLQMVWHKPGGFQPFGLPQYNCEFVIYARRGTPCFIDTKAFNCCNSWPRREPSRKPQEFYDLVRRVTAGPRVDMFSREPQKGFAQFGNETEKFAEAAE